MKLLSWSLVALGTLGLGWLALPASARPCCPPVCVPSVIVAYAQATKPGGTFSMEVDAHGALFRLEAEIDPAQLPKACAEAAEKAAPGGSVTRVLKDWIEGRAYFEVVKEIDGLRREVLMTPEGRVVGGETVLKADGVPAGVLAAAALAVPGGEVQVVEAITGPEALGASEHHVKTKVQGEVLRVSVLPGDRVGRVLRKIAAEVKVPRR